MWFVTRLEVRLIPEVGEAAVLGLLLLHGDRPRAAEGVEKQHPVVVERSRQRAKQPRSSSRVSNTK